MIDEQFPDTLRQAAKHYNQPPPTPREAMWARIEAERRAQTGRPRKVVYLPWVWGTGIAAVLALGVGLGRVSMRSEPATTVAVSRPAGPVAAPRASAPAPENAAPMAYQVAATDHLSRAEALLTSFRAQAASGGQADAQVAAWAGDLLSSTRLLLDSPAAEDPQLRVLLQDLELLLAQISQLPARRADEEVEMIERSLDQGDVLPRLRTAVPAGPPTTQT